MKGLVLNKLDC